LLEEYLSLILYLQHAGKCRKGAKDLMSIVGRISILDFIPSSLQVNVERELRI